MSLWLICPVLTILLLTPSVTEGDNSCGGFPQPGTLQLNVTYGNTIAVIVSWQNAGALSILQNYSIVACVDNNPDEKVIRRGMLTAPTYTEFQTLDYEIYIDRAVPISVTFSNGTCTTNTNQAVTFPFIVSGQPTVVLEEENATFTVTFAMMGSPSVTIDVVRTAIVEINVTATQGGAGLIRETTIFPRDFPRVTTTEILITNLTQDTDYRYTVRVLTRNSFTAVEIPQVVRGTFTTPNIDTGGSVHGVAVVGVVVSAVAVVLMISMF